MPDDPGPRGRTLLTLDEARSSVVSLFGPPRSERIPLSHAVGRVLASDVRAEHDQPPFRASAMDGYAVRFADVGNRLTLVGEAAAGHPHPAPLGQGEAVRIGTGAVVPDGADHILIREQAEQDGTSLRATEAQTEPGNIRRPGRDFAAGTQLLSAGTRIEARHIGVLAAANIAELEICAAPSVRVLTSGDELEDVGLPLTRGHIFDSAQYGLPALIESWGGVAEWAGRIGDEMSECIAVWGKVDDCGLLLIVGGASVGDRDLVRSSLVESGGSVNWSGVAIRPGKPAWMGAIGGVPVLGLPGNPAAALVAARLLLRPALAAALGQDARDEPLTGRLATSMPANGWRQAHERARRALATDGVVHLHPVADADSSRLSPFATADALIEREAGAKKAQEGELVQYRMI